MFDTHLLILSLTSYLLLALSLLLQLLEKVTNSQVQQERADRTKELEQQRALDMLPGTFDVLRAVFGDKGPCVKPKSEVGPRLCQFWLHQLCLALAVLV
jgi:hypothetical protein